MNQRAIIGIVFCFIFFVIGYVILNHISTMEDPPLGNTIYILIGSTLSILSILGVIVILKYLIDYRRKKERKERKRKKHRIHYLKKSNTNADPK